MIFIILVCCVEQIVITENDAEPYCCWFSSGLFVQTPICPTLSRLSVSFSVTIFNKHWFAVCGYVSLGIMVSCIMIDQDVTSTSGVPSTHATHSMVISGS